MTDSPLENTRTGAAVAAHLGAVLGPLIPWLVYRAHRGSARGVAVEAAKATNFSVLVLGTFVLATLVAIFVPLVGFLGTLAQLAIAIATVVLCIQAALAVRRGLPASYPFDFKVVNTNV